MGLRGPVPTDTSGLQPEPVLPDAPEHLSDRAKAEWEHYAPILYRLGLLTEADTGSLLLLVETWDTFHMACDDIKANGLYVMTPNGLKQKSPSVNVKNEATALLLKLAAQFGLSPAARTRLSVTKPDAKESKQSKWAGLVEDLGRDCF